MSKKREYDKEYKVQAVKFAKNIGSAKAAAEELQIPVNTWIQKVKTTELDIGCGEYSPEEALSIAKENQQLKKRIKALEKENLRFSQIDIASGLKNSRSIFLQYTINTVICQVSSTVSLSGYMISSSPRTLPQFLIGIVHFFVISWVARYKAFKSAVSLGNTLLCLFRRR